MTFEEFNRRTRCLEKKIVLTGAEPEQLETLLRCGIVEHREVALFPCLAERRSRARRCGGICARRSTTASPAATTNQTRTEHADICVVGQTGNGDIQRLAA